MRAILVGVGQGSWELGRVGKHLGLVTSICPDCMFCRSEEPCAFSSPTSLTEHPLQQEQQHLQTEPRREGRAHSSHSLQRLLYWSQVLKNEEEFTCGNEICEF